jgi:RimJ/RimL family protein N-acetyltransferase
MVYDDKIVGKYVYLKSAEINDAQFTLDLRQNSELTKYLPRLNISLEQQKDWIRSQREKVGDYFFVAWTNADKPIGTVSIYNIEGETSESGRLALIGDPIQNTEASYLLFKFAFDILGLKKVTGYIMDGNKRADRFNKLFGCSTGEVEQDDKGNLIRRTLVTETSFQSKIDSLKKILYRGDQL